MLNIENLLFSIIIPTYNSEKYIGQCLKSLTNQKFKSFEVIIVDKNSNDNTLIIAQKYCSYLKLRIYSEKDNGIYDAMNKGIKLALGEWVYFLGCDDYLYNSKVLSQISKFIKSNDLDVAYGNVLSSRFNGKYAGEFNHEKLIGQNICHQAIFFNKEIFKKIGYFNLKYKYLADYEYNIRWFFNNKIKIKYQELIIAYYADNGLSSINQDVNFINDKLYIIFQNLVFNNLKSINVNFFFKASLYNALKSKQILRVSSILILKILQLMKK